MKNYSKHIISVLNNWEKTGKPLDRFLSSYLRSHKYIGATNRRLLTETVFQLVRLQGTLDYGRKTPSWEKRLETLADYPPKNLDKLPPHIQHSFPLWYYEKLVKHYGEEGKTLCNVLNEKAPLTIRVNSHLITREALYEKWRSSYDISLTTLSPLGITWNERINFFAMEEFRRGYFEIQDEGSQLISLFVDAQPGEKILDYCSGSGGKSLGFAPYMQKTGKIYLHDIRPSALVQAKKRLKRAKIQNAQIVLPTKNGKNRLRGKMDKVLLDVPCSGSGTLRRSPETKWHFTKKDLDVLLRTQESLLEESLSFVKKRGTVIYATCSLFPEENEELLERFCKKRPLRIVKQKKLLVKSGQHDGFFMAALELFC